MHVHYQGLQHNRHFLFTALCTMSSMQWTNVRSFRYSTVLRPMKLSTTSIVVVLSPPDLPLFHLLSGQRLTLEAFNRMRELGVTPVLSPVGHSYPIVLEIWSSYCHLVSGIQELLSQVSDLSLRVVLHLDSTNQIFWPPWPLLTPSLEVSVCILTPTNFPIFNNIFLYSEKSKKLTTGCVPQSLNLSLWTSVSAAVE